MQVPETLLRRTLAIIHCDNCAGGRHGRASSEAGDTVCQAVRPGEGANNPGA